METENKQLSFPYVSYPTFKAFIDHLHDTVVTEQIDNSMMPQSMSGSARGAVISALKSLGLVDAQNNTSQKLKDLAKAYDTKEWTDAVRKNILSAYSGIIGSINLKSATRKQIDDLFADITPQVRDKCIRFFLTANKEAGIEYSPHLKIRRRFPKKRAESSTAPKGSSSDDDPKQHPEIKPKNEVTPSGMIDLPILGLSGSLIRVPQNISVRQITLVRAAVDYLEAMAKQNEASKE